MMSQPKCFDNDFIYTQILPSPFLFSLVESWGLYIY